MNAAVPSPLILVIFFSSLCCGLPQQPGHGGASKNERPAPPSATDVALAARHIMHTNNWLAIATLSTDDAIKGFPFVSLKSFSDGPPCNSTGVPYLYMTAMDITAKDVLKNNSVTIMASFAQSNHCDTNNYDAQDPRCGKVYISGNVLKLDTSSPEYAFGQDALFQRHPAMKYWPLNHGFYVSKVDVKQILVLNFFGGIKQVTPEDYFNADLSSQPWNKCDSTA